MWGNIKFLTFLLDIMNGNVLKHIGWNIGNIRPRKVSWSTVSKGILPEIIYRKNHWSARNMNHESKELVK